MRAGGDSGGGERMESGTSASDAAVETLNEELSPVYQVYHRILSTELCIHSVYIQTCNTHMHANTSAHAHAYSHTHAHTHTHTQY